MTDKGMKMRGGRMVMNGGGIEGGNERETPTMESFIVRNTSNNSKKTCVPFKKGQLHNLTIIISIIITTKTHVGEPMVLS